MEISATRALNARIAGAYDLTPFDPAPADYLRPGRVFGVGGLYGCHSRRRDVLDLGCGGGLHLAAAAEEAPGRLVGIDLSHKACEAARRRCAAFGARVDIRQCDFLDLKASDLGEFDLIYLLGTLYVVPEEVRDHLLGLVAACLRPGGVAVIGYYGGLLHAAKAHLYRMLRGMVPEGLPPGETVSQGRQALSQLQARLMDNTPLALHHAQALPDQDFLHEAFNPAFAPVLTLSLEARLSPSGIGFLTHLGPEDFGALASSRLRAIESEARDLVTGDYHRAVFGRFKGPQTGLNLLAEDLAWHSDLVRIGDALGEAAAGAYQVPGSDLKVEIARPLTQAILQEMQAAPRNLAALLAAASAVMAGRGAASQADETAVQADLADLWNYRLIYPRLLSLLPAAILAGLAWFDDLALCLTTAATL